MRGAVECFLWTCDTSRVLVSAGRMQLYRAVFSVSFSQCFTTDTYVSNGFLRSVGCLSSRYLGLGFKPSL